MVDNPIWTIPNLPPAIALDGTEQIWINQANVDKRTTLAALSGSILVPIPPSLIWVGNVFFEGSSPPVSNQLLSGHNLPLALAFPADNATALAMGWGLHVEAGSTPTNPFVISIAKNDILVATVAVAVDGTWSYAAANGAWSAAIRDRITTIAPSVADPTMNNFFLTMVGQIT